MLMILKARALSPRFQPPMSSALFRTRARHAANALFIDGRQLVPYDAVACYVFARRRNFAASFDAMRLMPAHD